MHEFCLVNSDRHRRDGLSEGIVRIERVGSGGRGMNGDRGAARGPDFRRNDDVRRVTNLPRQRYRRARAYGSSTGPELRNLRRCPSWNVGGSVQRRDLNYLKV